MGGGHRLELGPLQGLPLLPHGGKPLPLHPPCGGLLGGEGEGKPLPHRQVGRGVPGEEHGLPHPDAAWVGGQGGDPDLLPLHPHLHLGEGDLQGARGEALRPEGLRQGFQGPQGLHPQGLPVGEARDPYPGGVDPLLQKLPLLRDP